jgi:hypothetical protein
VSASITWPVSDQVSDCCGGITTSGCVGDAGFDFLHDAQINAMATRKMSRLIADNVVPQKNGHAYSAEIEEVDGGKVSEM